MKKKVAALLLLLSAALLLSFQKSETVLGLEGRHLLYIREATSSQSEVSKWIAGAAIDGEVAILDSDASVSKADDWVKVLWERAGKERPWVAMDNGKWFYEGPPGTLNEMQARLESF